MQLTTLFRPIGPEELALIAQSGWSRFPPPKPDQPFFFPFLDEGYASEISMEFNAPTFGTAYVVRFQVYTEYLLVYEVHNVGEALYNELWIPAFELEEFNDNIVGSIAVVKEFHKERRIQH